MKTRDLIERLQELDPSGERQCMFHVGQGFEHLEIEDVDATSLYSYRDSSGLIHWNFAGDVMTEHPTKAIVIG